MATIPSTQKGSCKNIKVYEATGLGQSGYGAYGSNAYIGGNTPMFTQITSEPALLTFSDSVYQEKEFVLPTNVFSSRGIHNIVVKSSDAIPSGATGSNAYQVYGAKTGILTGTLEVIGYTSNV